MLVCLRAQTNCPASLFRARKTLFFQADGLGSCPPGGRPKEECAGEALESPAAKSPEPVIGGLPGPSCRRWIDGLECCRNPIIRYGWKSGASCFANCSSVSSGSSGSISIIFNTAPSRRSGGNVRRRVKRARNRFGELEILSRSPKLRFSVGEMADS